MNERQYALTVGENVANTLTGTDYKGTQCLFEPISKTLKPCPNFESGAISAFALQGSMIGREDKNGPQGDGIKDDISFTLNTVYRHGVVYAIDRETFNCSQKYARNLGITEDSVASTLNAQGPSAVAQPHQNISGTISSGAHPCGFNGQDALNDMLIPVKQNDEHMELADYLKNHCNMRRQFRFCGLLLKLSTKPSTAIWREGQ